MSPLTLEGLVERARSAKAFEIRTHSLFQLRAALRRSPVLACRRAETALEYDERRPLRATLWGVRVVQDPRIPVGVAVCMKRTPSVRNLDGVVIPGGVRPVVTAALSSLSASSARRFADRMAFLMRGEPVSEVVPFSAAEISRSEGPRHAS